jgi:uncharacterized protein YdeI (YjbR/CyaY-like superfamily)
MPHTDPRIDEYILKSADFAKPVLNHLRSIIHGACPEVKETIKWGFPNFEYAGSILCSMASFKQHCAFTFWLGSLMSDPHKILAGVGEKTSMGQLGQIKTLNDLPADEILTQYVKEAMMLIEKGIKKPVKENFSSKEPEIPNYLLSALQQNENALKNFEKLSPSHKKEYLEWITEAKTEATRNKRISTTIEWMLEGKSRNWKYMKQ